MHEFSGHLMERISNPLNTKKQGYTTLCSLSGTEAEAEPEDTFNTNVQMRHED